MRHKQTCLAVSIILVLSFILISLVNKDMFYTSTGLYESDTIERQQNVHLGKTSTAEKILCRSRPEYFNQENNELDPKIVKDVDTMLMFIGYPRSGHTLIGSLLDAHPNIVVANEYNILGNWENYTTEHRTKQYLFEQLYTNSYLEAHEGDRSSKDCLPKTKYNYLVPNQWQGKFDGKIKVIGDKKGGKTTLLFQRNSQKYWSIFQEIRQEIKIPIKFLHVIRNPFDNMATLALRKRFGYSLNWTKIYESPVKLPKKHLIKYTHYHMKFAVTNARLLQQFHDQIHTLKSEDVIANPEFELRKICRFLNIQCSTKYVRDCVSIVRSKISRSRNGIVWDEEVKDIIFGYIQRIPFYWNYKFDE